MAPLKRWINHWQLFAICDKACQLHPEHQTHFAWTSRSYINHKVQSLPTRNGSDPATQGWTVLCCHQRSDPTSIPGRQYSRQEHSFIVFFFSDPLSLFHSSQVITFLSVTTQHRRTQIQSVAICLQRKLWKKLPEGPRAFVYNSTFTLGSRFPLQRSMQKIKARLQIWIIYLNKKQFLQSKL